MFSTRKLVVACAAIGAVMLLAVQADATIITTTNKADTAYTLTPDALGESATVTLTGNIERGEAAKLKDRTVGTDSDNANTFWGPNWGDSATATFTFDTAGHPQGYDITSIGSYAGGYLRATQGYQVLLTYVNNTTATLIPAMTFVDGNAPDDKWWSQVVHTNGGGGVLSNGSVVATGVKAITFTNFADAIYSGSTIGPCIYREFDIVGTASVPEPGTLLLAIAGLFGLLAYAWRKRK